jgi:hypothetical protein
MGSDALDERVREALGRSLTGRDVQLHPDPIAAVRHRVVRRRRRRRFIVGAAIAGPAILVSSALLITRDGEGRSPEVDVVASPSTAPTSPTGPIVSDPGGIERLPAPPIDVRADAALVWTGAEVVVWGGDVEAFNMGLPGDDRSYSDGAAFSPVTGRWRRLSPSPLPNSSDTPVGAMTNAGVLLARGRSTALWNPEDDTWRNFDDAPGPVNDLASNGDLVVSYSANAVLDTETGDWRELSPPPFRLERPTTAWTGRELVVIGGPGSAFTSAAAIAYDLERDEWRQLPSPPGDLHAEALSADWDGGRVVVVNYDMTALTYDPETDAWATLPRVPARFYEWYPVLRSSGGVSAAFMAQAIVVLTRDDRWVPMPYGTIPFGSVATTRPGFTVNSGDGTLFIWSLDSDSAANRLTAVDLDGLVGGPPRLQVGVGSIEPGEGAVLIDASSTAAGTENEVQVVIERRQGGRCTVSSAYGTGSVEQPVEETLDNDGRPTQWRRDATGQIWETAATTTDVFRIACEDVGNAAALARSASFGEQ